MFASKYPLLHIGACLLVVLLAACTHNVNPLFGSEPYTTSTSASMVFSPEEMNLIRYDASVSTVNDAESRNIGRMSCDASAYPTAIAYSDLEDYARSGTLSYALLGLNKTTTQAQTNAALARNTAANRTNNGAAAELKAAAASISTASTCPVAQISGSKVAQTGGSTGAENGAGAAHQAQLPAEVRNGPFERSLRAKEIRALQKIVCIPQDGRLTPDTRNAILTFLESHQLDGQKLKDSSQPGIITDVDDASLHTASDRGMGC
jgi:hypothetical protein